MKFRKQYVNYHSHAIGSMLDGHGKPKVYMEYAAELGLPGLGISDHGNLHVLLEWWEMGLKYGVVPILGMEAYQARKMRWDRDPEERAGQATSEWGQRGPYHLTVVAKNNVGYHNLLELSSDSYTEGYFVKGRIDHELIEKYSEGLIVLSGCLSGEVQQALLRDDYPAALKAAATMQEIVGKENYFIEIMNHGIPEELQVQRQLLEIADKIDAKVIPTCDCHYVRKEDHVAHDIMLCVSTKARISDEKRFRFEKEQFYLKSYDEMLELFPPEWLENTMDVFDMIEVDLKFGDLHFPSFPAVPKEETVDGFLERLVWEGAHERYGEVLPDEVSDRIKHELGVVQRMGFQEYFLVVWDLVNFAKKEGIRVGYGRGSAAGSILSYCLRITNLDPIKFGLLFERFLVEGRKSMPDIDLDFDDRYRHRVIDYAKQQYGMDNVAHIRTFTSIGARNAIKDAARVLDYDFATGQRLANLVPPPELGVAKTLDQALESREMQDAYNGDKEAKHILDSAKGLEGIYRQPGIHPAGVVICGVPVKKYAPVMRNGDDKPLVTQWTMDYVDKIGLLKVDFLGLANLSVIDMTVQNILGRSGTYLEIDDITLEDELTYSELRKGNSIGAFQIESSGMRDMMIALQPQQIEDIMALISLYRPGPMGITDKMYINRKHGREAVSFAHPILEDVLDKTYGLMIYQEDVLNVIRVLAGFDVGEADDIRKVIGKKLFDKVDSYQGAFVEGCVNTNDVKPELALKIWGDIKKFAGYGFNRAHAASYAMLSYLTAYLKFNHPAEYMAALMTVVSGKPDELPVYLYECSKMGLKVLPPSITRSGNDFKVDSDNEILYGLSGIKGIGPAIIGHIEEDKITGNTLHAYMRDCNKEILKKNILEHLSRSGALDEFVTEQIPVSSDNRKEILDAERAELGVYVTEHPLASIWEHVENKTTHTVADVESAPTGTYATIGGLISKVKKIITRRGQRMYSLTFEDMTGDIEIVVFPQIAMKLTDDDLAEGKIAIITGKSAKEGDEEYSTVKMFFDKIEYLDPILLRGGRPIKLRIERPLNNSEVERINDIIKNKPGDSIVYLEVVTDNTITFAFKRKASFEVKEMLEQLLKIGSVQVASGN